MTDLACEHGHLARSCEICEQNDYMDELQQQVSQQRDTIAHLRAALERIKAFHKPAERGLNEGAKTALEMMAGIASAALEESK